MTPTHCELSPLAQAVFNDHKAQPAREFYDLNALGAMFREEDVKRLDEAYEELVAGRLVRRSAKTVRFFSDVKPLYRLAEGNGEVAGAA